MLWVLSFVKIVSVSFSKSYIYSLQDSNIRIYSIGNNSKLRSTPKLQLWAQYTEEEHFKTGKYVAVDGAINAVKRCNPIQDGLFRGCSRMGGNPKRPPLPKICRTYPTIMKLGTVIPYPKKIHKIYESRDTPLDFCWHQYFFTRNQQILLYQEIQI